MSSIIYTMKGLGKIYPPDAVVFKDIYLSFLHGAKIGVLGANGAGKSTLLKIMAGLDLNIQGEATLSAGYSVGYLPQDPRTGDLDVLAKNRILSARGLDAVVDRLRRAELAMGDDSAEVRDKAMAAYARSAADTWRSRSLGL